MLSYPLIKTILAKAINLIKERYLIKQRINNKLLVKHIIPPKKILKVRFHLCKNIKIHHKVMLRVITEYRAVQGYLRSCIKTTKN